MSQSYTQILKFAWDAWEGQYGGLGSIYYELRTLQDMDRTLKLIFGNSQTTWDNITNISGSLQQREVWIFTKFEDCKSKVVPFMPNWNFWCF